MEINCKMTYHLPEELISALGITEDTAFETYFEDGAIHIHPLTDDELSEMESDEDEDDTDCDGNCEYCEFDDCCPYDEDDEDSEDDNDDGVDPDCEAEDCENCEYFCHRCGCCVLADEQEEDD